MSMLMAFEFCARLVLSNPGCAPAAPTTSLLRLARHYHGRNVCWTAVIIRRVLGMSNVHSDAFVNDTKKLVALCRTGRLYEIEKWIADGRPIDISGAIKRGRQR